MYWTYRTPIYSCGKGYIGAVLLSSKVGLVKISRARAKLCNSIVEP